MSRDPKRFHDESKLIRGHEEFKSKAATEYKNYDRAMPMNDMTHTAGARMRGNMMGYKPSREVPPQVPKMTSSDPTQTLKNPGRGEQDWTDYNGNEPQPLRGVMKSKAPTYG
jgi:hypothetical protein